MKKKAVGWEEIVSELLVRIEDGRLVKGDRLPTERQLAAEFQVSRAIVQSAIRQLTSLGAVERLQNCRPTVKGRLSNASGKLRNGKDQVAVWLHPSLEDHGAALILQGIRMTLSVEGLKPVIGSPNSLHRSVAEESELAFLRSMLENASTAGAIVWHAGGDKFLSLYESLTKAGVPLVFVDREPPEPIEADVVSTNHRRAAMNAVRHLIELGHTRIAMVANDEQVSSVENRVAGYRLALAEAGIEYRDEYFICLELAMGQTVREGADQSIASLLRMRQRPTAIFAVNDQIGMYLHDAAIKLGFRIPQDLSLIGFDWFMRWLPSGGFLTTMCQHFETIGRVAADRLIERIAAPREGVPRHILLEAPLLLKGTTAPPSD